MVSITDRAILDNMAEARSNGYDLACPYCGVGITDESDEHDYRCATLTPEFRAERSASEAAFSERLARIVGGGA